MKCTTTLATFVILFLGTATSATRADTGGDVSFSDTLRGVGFDDRAAADIEVRELAARRRVFRAQRWPVETAQDFARRWRRAESGAKLVAVRESLDEMIAVGTVTEAVARQRLERVERTLRPPVREVRFDERVERAHAASSARPTPEEMAIRIKASFLAQEQAINEAVADGRLTEEAASARLAAARRGLLSRLDLMDGRRHDARLQARLAEHHKAGESQEELRQTLGRLTRLMQIEHEITRLEHEADIGALAPDAAAKQLEELRGRERRLQD